MNEFATVSESRTVTAHGIFNNIKNNDGEDGVEYYAEFRHLVESIEKYETP